MGMWGLYDFVIRRFCGDGERTVEDDDDDDDDGDRGESMMGRRTGRVLAQQLEINEKRTRGDHRV